MSIVPGGPEALLEVRGLTVGMERDDGRAALAVEDVSFCLERGKTLCLVGESGCGKSVTALSLLRLLPSPPAKLLRGKALFQGRDLAALPDEELRQVRGNGIGMIFQEPMTSLNPVMPVGRQIAEGLRLHKKLSAGQAQAAAVAMLERVGLADAANRAKDYPHQMSGGMRQRVMIAMALACGPTLLIADEPTTALDVTIQGQILALIRELLHSADGSLLLITHDFNVVARQADQVAVMYAGKILEQGPARDLLREPAHPYTQGLLQSRPPLRGGEKTARLRAVPGSVPGLWDRPAGCTFHPRCPRRFEPCDRDAPPLFDLAPDRQSRCWLHR